MIEVEQRGAIAEMYVNRPEVRNAVSLELLEQLAQAWSQLERDPSVRVVILAGRGNGFISGGDIAVMRDLDPSAGRAFVEAGQRFTLQVEESRLVSVAEITGYALGGGLEIALSCDLRIAADDSRLGLPEVRLGLIPGWGGTQRLSRLIGIGRSLRMILSGEQVSGIEAERMGLVEFVVPRADIHLRTLEIANRIAANAPIAVRHARDAVKGGFGHSMSTALTIERDKWLDNLMTSDRVEGLSAFLERRRPIFRGE